jgi:hypothetical protein
MLSSSPGSSISGTMTEQTDIRLEASRPRTPREKHLHSTNYRRIHSLSYAEDFQIKLPHTASQLVGLRMI